jgi:hypothetical protein
MAMPDYLAALLGLKQVGQPTSLAPQTFGQTAGGPVDLDRYRSAIGWGSAASALGDVSRALLSGGRMSPLQALGTGLGTFGSGYQQARDADAERGYQNFMRDLQLVKYQTEQLQSQSKAAALEKAIAHLPPEQQDLARANPDAFLKPPSAPDAPKTAGGMYYDTEKKTFLPIPGYTEQAAAIAAAGRAPAPPRPTISGTGVTPEQFNAEEKIRDDFNQLPEVKNYKTVVPIIESAYETLGRDNHASDLNLIYALGKIMDPASVVREGEMIMATQAGSPASQVLGYMSYLTGGGKLPAEVRQQLVTELQSRVDALQSQYQQGYQRYSDIARSYGLDVNRTVGSATAQQRRAPPEVPPPPPGFVVDP